jgi:hypothetical protein
MIIQVKAKVRISYCYFDNQNTTNVESRIFAYFGVRKLLIIQIDEMVAPSQVFRGYFIDNIP